MIKWKLLAGIMLGTLTACSTNATHETQIAATVRLPLHEAWYAGAKVYYISTESSDPGLARQMGVNFAPRLADAIPNYPKPPEQKSAIERVYEFAHGEQDAVFASAPSPIGPASRDTQYSPLWLVYWITWKPGVVARTLTSEQVVLDEEARGSIEVVRSKIVVNCPIVGTKGNPPVLLPNAVISRKP